MKGVERRQVPMMKDRKQLESDVKKKYMMARMSLGCDATCLLTSYGTSRLVTQGWWSTCL